MTDRKPEDGAPKGVTRLSFIKASAGAAAGAAAIAIPAAVAADHSNGEITEPTTPNPKEPVMAYVRDARRGEVTLMHGTTETTYRDPALVKRLLDAAPKPASLSGGELDVLAP
ncbi:MAG TPA: hypothetical protein VKR21_11020 [Solirubrobacteraceae bacterium]|nr:hypothetical protein [Solirubrobacteraceae bacterium]